jgi:hypothetical protein
VSIDHRRHGPRVAARAAHDAPTADPRTAVTFACLTTGAQVYVDAQGCAAP